MQSPQPAFARPKKHAHHISTSATPRPAPQRSLAAQRRMRYHGVMTETPKDPIVLESERTFVPADSPAHPHRMSFFAFNTDILLDAWGDAALAERAFSEAIAACRTFERLLSRHLPHSDIARINAARGTTVPIDDITYDVLAASLGYCEASEGCFDITVGSVLALWNFHTGVIPDQEALDHALEHVGWRGVRLGGTPGARTARMADPLAMVDVGGTAKGYIADRVCEILAREGLRHFIVNLGGNVAVFGGKPDGSPFRVGIRDPKNPEGILGAVALETGSFVTSGTTERFFERDGVRYHHILNPRTGWPVATDAAAAGIVSRRSFDGDGFSTTLLALGIERGTEFARSRPEIALAVFVDENNRLSYSR